MVEEVGLGLLQEVDCLGAELPQWGRCGRTHHLDLEELRGYQPVSQCASLRHRILDRRKYAVPKLHFGKAERRREKRRFHQDLEVDF